MSCNSIPIACARLTKNGRTAASAVELGVKSFLTKPITQTDLARTVRDVLDKI